MSQGYKDFLTTPFFPSYGILDLCNFGLYTILQGQTFPIAIVNNKAIIVSMVLYFSQGATSGSTGITVAIDNTGDLYNTLSDMLGGNRSQLSLIGLSVIYSPSGGSVVLASNLSFNISSKMTIYVSNASSTALSVYAKVLYYPIL